MVELCGKLQSKAVPASQQGAARVDHHGTGPAPGHPHLVETLPGRKQPPAALQKSPLRAWKAPLLSTTHTCTHRHMPSKSEFWRLHVPSCLCSLHLYHLSLSPQKTRMPTSGKQQQERERQVGTWKEPAAQDKQPDPFLPE